MKLLKKNIKGKIKMYNSQEKIDNKQIYWIGLTEIQKERLIDILMPIYNKSESLIEMGFIKELVLSLGKNLDDWIPFNER